jgi:hypothetical protein
MAALALHRQRHHPSASTSCMVRITSLRAPHHQTFGQATNDGNDRGPSVVVAVVARRMPSTTRRWFPLVSASVSRRTSSLSLLTLPIRCCVDWVGSESLPRPHLRHRRRRRPTVAVGAVVVASNCRMAGRRSSKGKCHRQARREPLLVRVVEGEAEHPQQPSCGGSSEWGAAWGTRARSWSPQWRTSRLPNEEGGGGTR